MTDWYPKRRIGDLPGEMAARFGGHEGLVFQDRRYTFAEMATEVDRTARALMAQGIQRGDHVAVWLNNSDTWLFLQFAIARIGAVLVPANTRFRSADMEYLLRQSDTACLITHDVSGPIEYLGMIREIVKFPTDGARINDDNFPKLRQVITLSETRHPGTITWQDALDNADAVTERQLTMRAESVDPDDPMLIMYTSGSTGFPKGALHNHRLVRNVEERAFRLGISPRDTLVNYLPLFHAFGMSEGNLISMVSGMRQILTEMFDPDEALDLIEKEKATITHGFDTHINMLVDAQEKRKRDVSTIRYALLPAGPSNVIPTAHKMYEVFPSVKTVSGFGMTETWACAAVGSLADTFEQACEASGEPALGYEIRVMDPETGQPAETEVPGEIQVKGITVMLGYYKKPEQTRASFTDDGWFKTGDMGYWRADGHLRFVGRYKDMLKVGGENVDPLEVEGFLLRHDGIAQASVIGLPDRKMSEVPVAYVQKADGSTLSEEDVIGLCRGQLASFKIPRHVVFVDDYPMTGSGKIRKVDLREMALKHFAEGNAN